MENGHKWSWKVLEMYMKRSWKVIRKPVTGTLFCTQPGRQICWSSCPVCCWVTFHVFVAVSDDALLMCAGNILLNILLTSNIPASRQGTNNVSLVCAPTTPQNSGDKCPSRTPTCMLIRVKTSDMADELFNHISKCKDKWDVIWPVTDAVILDVLVAITLTADWQLCAWMLYSRVR